MKNFDKPPEIEKISKKKIAEISPEYQGDRYGAESYSSDHAAEDCFGQDLLDVVENTKERLIPVEERLIKMGYFVENAVKQSQREVEERRTFTPAEAVLRIHRGVSDTVERFRGLMLKREFVTVADSFLYEAVEIPEIRTALREQTSLVSKNTLAKYRKFRRTLSPFHNFFGSDEETVVLSALIATKRIPDEIWIRIIENHNRLFKNRVKEFQEELLPEIEKQFQARIEEAIRAGGLPISNELLNRRLNETHATLKDALHARLEEVGGQYNPDTGEVYIDSFLAYEVRKITLEHVYFHEMFHALSGRVIVNKKEELKYPFGETDTIDNIEHERIGLHFRVEVGSKKKNRFRWLNEAVTELLTEKYAPPAEKQKDKYVVYVEQKELLHVLVHGGKAPIDLKLFIDAYFENLDPTIEPEKRLPAWKTLSTHIDAVWGHGFLNRVDESVKKNGVKETIHKARGGFLTV